jgi:8-oxo-dGTP pyrophosphatase MutT (NUDIX family)
VADLDVADRPESWPVVGSVDLHRDDWVVGLRQDQVQRPGHPEETFRRLVLTHPGASLVLAVDDEERVCCIRQYRHAAQGVLVELPAGILDADGEEPQRAAERELREEVELEAASWRHLFMLFPSAGISAEKHHVFVATGLSHAGRGDFEMVNEEAEIEVVWVPVEDLVDAVLDGRVTDGPIAAAVLGYDALKRRGRL